ncbi:MAG TPA: hypothetical protein VH189_01170 [Rhizomicrobium sp.]|nr:hypothetical protein [Rhizomicrobium sp.]
MKAALDAWGFRHNAFQQGFASQTNDARIIAAATARPGIVLRRPVGTSQPFQEDAGLPEDFAIPKIGKAEKAVPKPAPAPRPKARTPVRKGEGKAESAAIISFEKEKARRDHQRAQEDVRTKRARAKRQHAIDQAQSGLEKARLQHERKLEKLERERALLERRMQKEQESWQARRGSLESALDRAHKQ